MPEDEAHPANLGSFGAAREGCRISLADAAAICGVAEADIVKAAEWIAKPKDDGSRRKCVTAYEKGIIWGNAADTAMGCADRLRHPARRSCADPCYLAAGGK